MTDMTNDTLRRTAEANLKQALGAVWVYPAAADTLDMLALFTETERRAFYDMLTAGLGYRRERYERLTRECARCGSWRCAHCGHVKTQVRLTQSQTCRKCTSIHGTAVPHRHSRAVWERHNPGTTWPE